MGATRVPAAVSGGSYGNSGRGSPASRAYHSHSHSFPEASIQVLRDHLSSPQQGPTGQPPAPPPTPPTFMFTRDDPAVLGQHSNAGTPLTAALNMAEGRGASQSSSQRVNAESNQTDSAVSDSGSAPVTMHVLKRPRLTRELQDVESVNTAPSQSSSLYQDPQEATTVKRSEGARPAPSRIVSGNDVDFYLGMKKNAPQTLNDEIRVKQLDSLLHRNVVITPSLEKRGPELEAAIHLATIASGAMSGLIDDGPLYVTVAEPQTTSHDQSSRPEKSGSDFSSYGTTPSLVADNSTSGGSTSTGRNWPRRVLAREAPILPIIESQQEDSPAMASEPDPQEEGEDAKGVNGAGKYVSFQVYPPLLAIPPLSFASC